METSLMDGHSAVSHLRQDANLNVLPQLRRSGIKQVRLAEVMEIPSRPFIVEDGNTGLYFIRWEDDPTVASGEIARHIGDKKLRELEKIEQAAHFDDYWIGHKLTPEGMQRLADQPFVPYQDLSPASHLTVAVDAFSRSLQSTYRTVAPEVKKHAPTIGKAVAITAGVAAFALIAPLLFAGTVAAAAIDPVIYGVRAYQHRNEPGNIAAWYYLTHFDWPVRRF